MIPERVECISMPNRKRILAETKGMVFRPCAYAIIVNEGKILLPKLPWDEPKPFWLPGGGIEAGESTEDNLKRELIEEAGMAITVDSLAAVHDQFVYWENRQKPAHYIMILYHCTALTTEIQPPDAELDDIEMME